ncbi:hypothetical protein ASD02_33045 [Ensifer sp. Root1252]|jgi:uncharacterized protein|nr:hypothetical protein ASD00_19190 [Ensifer sp. Root31]KQW49837.1 hypothetical protein ASD02_33045 [Ensifer sp. Root1252]KRC57626.1 hypothetical protein ASE32_18965 [Ensifer sp. Root231]KRD00274.1 hypothetical protein ASE47_25720 [Ensifer sp. Root258]MBD9490596.1 DUF418 domain-containing protein [Ensifer sp. ENS11]NOV14675.1 DUF418 domain-containing protein [Ensifer canadensis]PSS62632.1 DUF418 domain-containing protein [Ensifer sp. NM-2]
MTMTTQDRIDGVDALRGFALLGILLVNIMAFASAFYGLELPDPSFDTGLDRAVHFAVALFFEMKFYLLFSFLFGYSFTLQMRSAEKAGDAFVPRLLRRQAGLWLIGLTHAVLLFHGDILTTYAVLGIALMMLRTRSDASLWRLARLLVISTALAWFALGVAAVLEPPVLERYAIIAAAAATEAAFRGDWQSIIGQHLTELSSVWVILGLLQAPSALAMFLVGLIAGRRQILSRPQENRALFRWLVRLGLFVGLPGAVIYAYTSVQMADSPQAITGLAVGLLTAPFLTGAYVGAMMLFLDSAAGRWLRNLLAPAGRTALSNYLLQSLICALIFHGYGFGLIGHISPLETVSMALVVYAAQLVLSRWWLQRFAYGPLEWLLRLITIWRVPQWRNLASADRR